MAARRPGAHSLALGSSQNGASKEVRYLRPTLIELLKRRRAARSPHFLMLDIQLVRYMKGNKYRLPEARSAISLPLGLRARSADNDRL